MHTELSRPFYGVQTHWTYVPSRPPLKIVLRRWLASWARQSPPAFESLKPPSGPDRWLLYFMYLPKGQMSVQHHFTLDRLATENARLMIVCACPPGHQVLKELDGKCDALCWKALEGFDFSAYALGLTELARLAPGSDVMVLNDSMLGPFAPLTPFIEQAPWTLTGLTASVGVEENHLQSYAFVLKGLNPELLSHLSDALSTHWCYSQIDHVILQQETRLARVAHQHMSVGAYWYTDGAHHVDLCLNCPEQLLDAGFPLLKRSLFQKFAGKFQDSAAMQAMLRRLGHPEMPEAAH